MKKIILILFLTSIFAEYNNPNGKPFTLNISANIGNTDGYNGGEIKINMPITSWITINGGWYNDRYKNIFTRIETEEPLRLENIYSNGFYDVFCFGVELHLPLYKIWEN